MKFICIGDSVTYGYGVSGKDRWTTLTEKETSYEIINRGVCGDTTGGMLVRMNELLKSEIPAMGSDRYVFLMGGCNDIFYSGTDSGARANMGAMIHQLATLGEAPIIGIPMGIAKGNYPRTWVNAVDFDSAYRKINEYGAWIERFCEAFNVRTADFRYDFQDRNGNPRAELYLDGLHPSVEGHRVMAERIIKIIGMMERNRMDA